MQRDKRLGTKVPVVFTGYNQRAVIAFIRTLKKHNLDFALVAKSEDDPIFDTDYKDHVLYVRTVKQLNIEEVKACLKVIGEKYPDRQLCVMPSTESLNRFLIDNRQLLVELGCGVPLVNKGLYEIISDKKSFGELCADAGILVPGTLSAEEAKTIPSVAKPKTYYAADGNTYSPQILLTEKDAEDFFNSYPAEDFYFQPYITGGSYYFLFYIYKDGRVAELSQENLVQQPYGKSVLAAKISNVHLTQTAQQYKQMLVQKGFSGLVMVEVKGSGEDLYMIEANPRFWGPSQLFVDAGVNLFEHFLFDQGILENGPRAGEAENALYFWGGGYRESMQQDGFVNYHNYDAKKLENNIAEWIASDVYNRPDTVELYNKETGVL